MRPALPDSVGWLITAVGFKIEAFLMSKRNENVAGVDGVDSSAEAANTSSPTLKWFRYLLLTPKYLGGASGRCFGDGGDKYDLLHARKHCFEIRLCCRCTTNYKAMQRIAFELTRQVFGVARVLQGWTAVGLDCGDMPVHVYFKT